VFRGGYRVFRGGYRVFRGVFVTTITCCRHYMISNSTFKDKVTSDGFILNPKTLLNHLYIHVMHLYVLTTL